MGKRLDDAASDCAQRVSPFMGQMRGETRHTASKTPAQPSLMTGMIQALGLDPDTVAREVGADAFAGMAAQCQGCSKPDSCILWMIDQAQAAPQTPDFCLNGEQLDALSVQKARSLKS